VALESPFRVHVEMDVAESVDDGIKEGRPLRAALLFIHLSLYQQVGGDPAEIIWRNSKGFR